MQEIELRQRFELIILGTILVDSNSIFMLENILSEKNFSSEKSEIYSSVNKKYITHSQVFSEFKKLSQNTPIDLITACNWFNKIDKTIAWHYHLSRLAEPIMSSANLKYHAYLLLEIDIKEKFKNLIANTKKDFDDNIILKSILDEAFFETEITDTFVVCEALILYLKKSEIDEDVIEVFESFQNTISKKAANIKEQNTINHHARALMAHAKQDLSPYEKKVVESLLICAKTILISGQTPQKYIPIFNDLIQL